MDEEITVLVVDEETDMLDLTETFLERESEQISVTTEQDPVRAIEQAGSFDCIVSDLRMPKINGIELAEQIHDETPDRPVFLFTAADGNDIQSDGADLAGVVRKGTGTEHYTELAEQIVAIVE
ncbi:response regulator [Halobacteriaceae archaeon SHR40]|uniref:response regulator n=1 Tax=Halovenus amylolytica TaxID=2500550 RepID=UPI000FE2A099